MSKLFIPVLLGTIRQGRKSEAVAKYIESELAKRDGVETIAVDPRELNLPGDGSDAKDPKYSDITKRADAFFVVTPEYNHSFPGSLKRMLDSEYPNYKYKPVAVAGVSSGAWGGIRAVQSLMPALRKFGLVLLQEDVHVTHSNEAFDEQGNPTNEHLESSVNKTIDELILLATALQSVRIAK